MVSRVSRAPPHHMTELTVLPGVISERYSQTHREPQIRSFLGQELQSQKASQGNKRAMHVEVFRAVSHKREKWNYAVSPTLVGQHSCDGPGRH